MRIDVEVEGCRYRATVKRAEGTRLVIEIQADDATAIAQEVDVCETDVGISLVHAGSGRVVDAAIAALARGQVLVQLPHVDVIVDVNGRRPHAGGATDNSGTGEQRLCAPMPGRIVRVLVKPGDVVVAGQAMVVIEAMKMENALTAVRDGRVSEVTVIEGASVEAGRLLISLE